MMDISIDEIVQLQDVANQLRVRGDALIRQGASGSWYHALAAKIDLIVG